MNIFDQLLFSLSPKTGSHKASGKMSVWQKPWWVGWGDGLLPSHPPFPNVTWGSAINLSPSICIRVMQCQFRMCLLLSLLYSPPQWLALVLLNTHGLQHSKLKKITNMAPKLQSKTLETKAQTCPPSEEFPGEAVAESSGDVSDRMTCISFHDCKNTALKSSESPSALLPNLPEDPSHSSSRGEGRSVWLAVILRALELYFQSLHANLKSIHWLDGSLCRDWIVVTYKTWGKEDKM